MSNSSPLLASLLEQLGTGGMEQIGRQVGLDQSQVGNVLAGAIPVIMAGLARNTGSADGAVNLHSALDRDHDGSILDDVVGFLGGGGNLNDGAAILGHVFGDRTPHVERTVSTSTGIDAAKVSKIMMMVAPLVLGALGRATRQNGYDPAELSSALRHEQARAHDVAPSATDILSRILDSDGDGSAADDLMKIGTGLLGSLLR